LKISHLPSNVIDHVIAAPPDLLGIRDEAGERLYLRTALPSYERTLRDVEALLGGRQAKLLEIGAFLGVVSFSLKARGHQVVATDIPEFAGRDSIREYYRAFGVEIAPVNLRHRRLPFADAVYDGVIMCETLEHLNFNPLPILLEINRVLKPGGFLYNSMPNGTRLIRRLRFLAGRPIHPPIEDFFVQLDPRENNIVGIHWREYSLAETCEMLTRLGFEVRSRRLVSDHVSQSRLRNMIVRLAALLPAARTTQVVVAEKKSYPDLGFRSLEASS
jgi:SAM-dependent methyltransferase